MNNSNTVVETISKEKFTSTDMIIPNKALLTALSKIEKYQAECDVFKHKYEMSFEEFDLILHKKKGKEDINREEDCEDWEFALNALKWWRDKVR